jgi:hypothetical protein
MSSNGISTILFDARRLAIAGALAVRDMTSTQIQAHTGLGRVPVLEALGELRSVGLVASDDEVYRLDLDALRRAARDAAESAMPMDPAIGFGMTDDERIILERFFSGRVLDEIPTQRSKRLVVLQRLALEFDPGRRYSEFEVNEVLGGFHPDWSALRRGLVDEGLLDREPKAGGNVYWRSGGRVPASPSV